MTEKADSKIDTKKTNNYVALGSIDPSNIIFMIKKKLNTIKIIEKEYQVEEFIELVFIYLI